MTKRDKNIERQAKYAFSEERFFNDQQYIRLAKKGRESEAIAAFHYAPTLEILLCKGAGGQVFIGNNCYSVKDKDVFIIPPNVIHATLFQVGTGEIYVFKLSLPHIKKYLDVENIMKCAGRTIYDCPFRLTEKYEEMHSIIIDEIYNKEGFYRIVGVIKLISILNEAIPEINSERIKEPDEKIYNVISWTKEHYAEEITIERVSKEMSMSLPYFCKWFKMHTGVTYKTYLNELRVSMAIRMLKNGHDATGCCYACGFNNSSYFAAIFKRITGYTTSEYKKILLNRSSHEKNNK